MAKALAAIWERAYDPDPSPDPVVRNFQDLIDKLDAENEKEVTDISMESVHGDIHRETLKCLPAKISTTSHYRYVLATMRNDQARLRDQIETDRDMVAAMDSTLDALRSLVVDKGKERDPA
jgi:hypothetical protein